MRLVRASAGAIVWAFVLAPIFFLPAAAVFDRGPDGSPRPTVFHLALAASDPFVWDAVRLSLLAAAGLALGSCLLGVALARSIAGRAFPGRGLLLVTSSFPLMLPPLVPALGLRIGLERWGQFDGWRPWAAWIFALALGGVARVAWAALDALESLDPTVREAALVSASPGHAWRRVLGPLIRPAVARAVAGVFALTLVDPGAALVLNLRRTLGYQIIQATTTPDGLPRAAALGLLALAAIATVRAALRRWSGPLPIRDQQTAGGMRPRTRSAQAILPASLLILSASLAILPLVALVPVAGRPFGSSAWPAGLSEILGDGTESGRAIRFSAGVGLAVAMMALPLAWLLLALRRGGPAAGRATLAPPGFPSTLHGLGALGLLAIAGMATGPAQSEGVRGAVASIGRRLDPATAPGFLLAWALLATALPPAIRCLQPIVGDARRDQVEAAWTLGAPRGRAWRTIVAPRVVPAALRAGLLVAMLVALDSGAALVLGPSFIGRPIGPTLIDLADAPGGLPTAAALGLILAVGSFAGWAILRHEPGR